MPYMRHAAHQIVEGTTWPQACRKCELKSANTWILSYTLLDSHSLGGHEADDWRMEPINYLLYHLYRTCCTHVVAQHRIFTATRRAAVKFRLEIIPKLICNNQTFHGFETSCSGSRIVKFSPFYCKSLDCNYFSSAMSMHARKHPLIVPLFRETNCRTILSVCTSLRYTA